ncbi:pyridoxamine 5'-phosphate oxidase family protein [Actinoplanes couchii]|uniref:pyridoxamine 5'-phosphate oxidase family protein n=1 Tax=Actinoplanes couchii TaxID=403638 RepID=UPI001EF18565|nr:pyridoxamine 5'-phosphate oxidase family protein [Actinoplanes couchii]MDR6315873.1 nitroimidazol reductase NimA-like FMN-containing flavoprotein (pyridoxamine 5'-phosphate oxidase superfamily) [Actinoplanes couchii]
MSLEESILNLLATHNMCVLATTDPSGAPHATPVRYFADGFDLIVTSLGDSPKIRNLRADPRMSAGVFAPLTTVESSRGAQLFGTARILSPGDEEFESRWRIVTPRIHETERDRFLADPARCVLAVLSPARIVYTDHWQKRDGHPTRRTLTL